MIRTCGIQRITSLMAATLLLLTACAGRQLAGSNVHSGVQPHYSGRVSDGDLKAPVGTATPGPTPATVNRFTEADFARHVVQLRKKLPSAAFAIVIQPPFVVVGDEPLADVQRHAKDTIKWAVDRLKQDFFRTIRKTF
jgi:hypothetical protein